MWLQLLHRALGEQERENKRPLGFFSPQAAVGSALAVGSRKKHARKMLKSGSLKKNFFFRSKNSTVSTVGPSNNWRKGPLLTLPAQRSDLLAITASRKPENHLEADLDDEMRKRQDLATHGYPWVADDNKRVMSCTNMYELDHQRRVWERTELERIDR
jgi:hypothetical protein